MTAPKRTHAEYHDYLKGQIDTLRLAFLFLVMDIHPPQKIDEFLRSVRLANDEFLRLKNQEPPSEFNSYLEGSLDLLIDIDMALAPLTHDSEPKIHAE